MIAAAGIPVRVMATPENFDEAGYLGANPDVAEAVRKGEFKTGRKHFEVCGRKEQRQINLASSFADMQRRKIERVEPLLKRDMPHVRRGPKYDFLTAELRAATSIGDTINVAASRYDPYAAAMVAEFKDGLLLDCGAGRHLTYYPNVVNYEIVDYDTTDVLGVGEALPFKDASFDGVLSLSVLEHVRDPFACAAEIVRVLKPGGKLICCAPFLAPLHGFPHHYYNMSPQGLRALFDRRLEIDDHKVVASTLPVWALTWMVQSWANGLSGKARDEFLAMPMRELMANAVDLLDRTWVKQLPEETNFELACGTMLFAHKPSPPLASTLYS